MSSTRTTPEHLIWNPQNEGGWKIIVIFSLSLDCFWVQVPALPFQADNDEESSAQPVAAAAPQPQADPDTGDRSWGDAKPGRYVE